jgi:hypothetical protein
MERSFDQFDHFDQLDQSVLTLLCTGRSITMERSRWAPYIKVGRIPVVKD